MEILLSKPVLIGIHLGFGIIGIDAFLWFLGEIRGKARRKPIAITALVGTLSFLGSWVAGGYYYVNYYGGLVKPSIKEGLAPWAHNVIMETKEHIFLFIIPLAITAYFTALLSVEEMERAGIRKIVMCLAAYIALLGLSIGAMGFIISAAARWGVVN